MLTPPKIIDALKLVFWLKIFNVFYRKKVETEILKGTIIMSLRQKQTNDAGLSGLSLGVSAPKIKAETPPNIVFMMSDDIGYNDLAAYGQSY
ncbi:MAG: hypothetical protein ABR497_11515, partial [Kiritimatiellia bacterium]